MQLGNKQTKQCHSQRTLTGLLIAGLWIAGKKSEFPNYRMTSGNTEKYIFLLMKIQSNYDIL